MKRLISLLSVLLSLSLSAPVLAGTCTVYVTWPSGQAREGVRVSGSVTNGGVTETFRTDKKGKAVVRWSSESSLSKVFVDGSTKGKCKSGGTLRVTAK